MARKKEDKKEVKVVDEVTVEETIVDAPVEVVAEEVTVEETIVDAPVKEVVAEEVVAKEVVAKEVVAKEVVAKTTKGDSKKVVGVTHDKVTFEDGSTKLIRTRKEHKFYRNQR